VVRAPRVAIRIGEPNGALDRLIGAAASAAFLTAANPRSERRGDEENRRLTAALGQVLDRAGYRHLEGEGRDPQGAWPPEPSFLVLGIGRGEALALARRFEQNAFVWCAAGEPPALVLAVKWRLVLDTHVWLDWLAFDDPSVQSLKNAVAEERAEVYMDPACEAELERVLAYPIARRIPGKEMQAARLAEARRIARRPDRELSEAERASLPRCGDRDDQKFLELALAARADALLTKDRALLALARRTPFRIVPPAAFAFS
jgi:putative PIN family toxin of toxin-antitoxin system